MFEGIALREGGHLVGRFDGRLLEALKWHTTHIHTYTNTHTHTQTHTYIHTHTHTQKHTYTVHTHTHKTQKCEYIGACSMACRTHSVLHTLFPSLTLFLSLPSPFS